MYKYVELHCHSNFSFQEGASSIDELLLQASALGYPALALTDHDNLCAAMEFSRCAASVGIAPIIGAEVTTIGGFHLTLLAATRTGYSNLCRLLSAQHIVSDRLSPAIDPALFAEHAEGLLMLTGCAKGIVPSFLTQGFPQRAEEELRSYIEYFGSTNVFVELQQNYVHGDISRNKGLVELGRKLGVRLVATNNVHYHKQSRSQLQDCLVAISHSKTLETSHRERRPNNEFYLKTPREMAFLFTELPEAIANTLVISEFCNLDLSRDLGYGMPNYLVPPDHTMDSYLRLLCEEAATRRYGGLTPSITARLDEEFTLISKHNMAGFLLLYHEIIQIAREIQIDLGLVDREISLEELPPGRGRGSSVSMLVGYLIGLSHIDPLLYGLSMERFLPEDILVAAPDIDLDFPRNIREELILRVHQKYGWDRAALTGMFTTYQPKSIVRDLGRVLGVPTQHLTELTRNVGSRDFQDVEQVVGETPVLRGFAASKPWTDFVRLASELSGFPRGLAQHPGGMIIASSPLIDMVPVQKSAIDGRYICQWDKNSIADAGFVKIDFLALGVLSQMQDTLQAIEKRIGYLVDLSRIDFDDQNVYEMLHDADTIGVFQIESAAQIQTIKRIRPRNLIDMAHQVAAVRPGVGVHDGVRHYIQRRLHLEKWEFDHPLERRALDRTFGVILMQDQMNQLAIDVAGFTPGEAEQLRRMIANSKRRSPPSGWWEKFRIGAAEKNVPEEIAWKIFGKFNGYYMFPESHAFAFGTTAYQMGWLKYYYPLEFYLGLFNQQPMGFYSPETLKEDARRHNIMVLNPDVNMSSPLCVIENNDIRLGLTYVKHIGSKIASQIVSERKEGGSYGGLRDFMGRVGLLRVEFESLAHTGALDAFGCDRRGLLWDIGLHYTPPGRQPELPLLEDIDRPILDPLSSCEIMTEEYRFLGMHPTGHIMAYYRSFLEETVTSVEVEDFYDHSSVVVAGLVIRRQHPARSAIFITLEDEWGHIPLIVWPSVYRRFRNVFTKSLLKIWGIVSRRDGTLNVIVERVEEIPQSSSLPRSHDWK